MYLLPDITYVWEHTCPHMYKHMHNTSIHTVHMHSDFWFIYFRPRTTVNTFVFLWVFKALWLWHIALGVILRWAQNQWASVWKHFTVGTQTTEKKKDLKPNFFQMISGFRIIRTTSCQHHIMTCCIILKDAAGVKLNLRGLCYNQSIYFFLRNDMLIYIYGP